MSEPQRQDLGTLRMRAQAMWELMQADRRTSAVSGPRSLVLVLPDAVLEGAGRRRELCTVCARAAVDAHDEWTWTACESCRSVDAAAARLAGGERLLPLGRHLLMNTVVVAEVAPEALTAWRRSEVQRIVAAAGLDDEERVPWVRWPRPGRDALRTSAQAYVRLLARELPDLVAAHPSLASTAALLSAARPG